MMVWGEMMGVSEFWNSIDAWLVEQKNGGSWTDSKTKEEDESKTLSMCIVTPCFPNNVNNTSNQSIQRKMECHTTFKT